MFYIYADGEQKGPFDDQIIKACLKDGTFKYSDLIWQEGWDEWKQLEVVFKEPTFIRAAESEQKNLATRSQLNQIYKKNAAPQFESSAEANLSEFHCFKCVKNFRSAEMRCPICNSNGVAKVSHIGENNSRQDGKKLCTKCGYIGNDKRITKGSFLLELLLWLAALLPGLVYSIWRFTSRYKACPECLTPNMIPTSSPIAQKLLREQT
jgi:hypothetical protein